MLVAYWFPISLVYENHCHKALIPIRPTNILEWIEPSKYLYDLSSFDSLSSKKLLSLQRKNLESIGLILNSCRHDMKTVSLMISDMITRKKCLTLATDCSQL